MESQRVGDASKRVIEETKRLYANLLTEPLDERQLVRPSFKFIQGITKSLITETRTLRKVFNPIDFETEHKTWDRRRKGEFIQRLIDFAANHKQPVVGCVAAKLVAGLEPIKANELLQSLAKIAQAQLSGLDGNPKRPRTFTKQTPSVSSKQPNERKNSASSTLSSKRNLTENRPRAGSKRLTPSNSRDLSADRSNDASKRDETSDGRSRVTSDEMPPPVARLSVSKAGAIDDVRYDSEPKPATSTDTGEKSSHGTEARGQTSTMRQSISRLSSSSIGPHQPSSQIIVVSESDIGKNMQQLRLSLDQLRPNLMELFQFDLKLRSELVANMKQCNKVANV